ncbi:uncharacterized protein METZ01_LOCUS215686 [marine metagenome]|uniref:Uncharacterized protein n=1 Tax=marine metagenome TaxID=408172 RepID=A0A382FJM0_9ZZZZ
MKTILQSSSLIKLVALNDVNGNEQHIYLNVSHSGEIIKAYDVANKGIYAVPEELKIKAINANIIYISQKEYKRILKEYE